MFHRSFLLVGFFLVSLPAWAQEQLVDRVVAVVNDEAITQSELDIYLRPLYEELKKQLEEEELLSQLNQIRLKLLNQMIEDRLVFQEAKKLGIIVRESEIDEQMNEVRSRFPSETEFEKVLRAQGMTLTQIRERYEREITIRRLHDVEIRSRVVVSPQEIEDFYKNRKAELAEEEKVRLRSLTVRKGEEAVEKGIVDEKAKAKIESLRQRIEQGEDLAKLAQEFSDDPHAKQGGEIGWVKRGEMLPTIDEIIFNLKAGETSSVLETSAGYHFFKVEEKVVSEIPPFEKARGKIQEILFREEARDRFKEWMSELKARAYISIR
jgi:peptidyl-prolyl cis-trans isomerase SurA